ncbi:AAA family ATPase [Peribacillus simplex]|uniref:McrB family protein n=1 Tax=Peribacillus simplex TaxID=1478 RepID=UPI002E1BA216|nr:AAA family ATPase [Peribacillus simplex]MED3986984.1 AAA family ATPase [Peribacillus simplex]MED4094256.1 AAA family ATPase [Peribacillus simplex]
MANEKTIELTNDLINEIVNQHKKEGKLGTEIMMRVDKIVIQPRSRYLYICQLLQSREYFDEMINPWTDELWTVGFFEKGIYKLGDVLVGSYGLQKNEKKLDQLIRPIASTLVKLEHPSELVDKHGEEFVQFLHEKFGGEEELIGLMYERFMKTAEKDIKEQEELKRNILKQIEQLSKEIDEKNKNLNKLAEDIKLEEQKKEDLELQFLKIRRMFGLEGPEAHDTQEAVHVLQEDEDFFQAVQRRLYHINGENLVYEYDIIKRFITALRTDQLVLLTGPSGTGKSSLVHQMGEVLHPCKVHHIAVQSNWTDVQDLLGFFNPLKNTYMPTPFLQALVDARNDRNSLHIICLDEMNLAHVEYYFSSLLSTREKSPEKRFLDLYAYKFYREAMLDLEELVGGGFSEITSADIEILDSIKRKEAREKYELILDYPAQFLIPKNVRFVGTLNMDETVKPLSPKVIDRSFIIELDHPSKLSHVRKELEKHLMNKKIEMDINEFIQPALEEPQLTMEQAAVIDTVLDWTAALHDIPNAVMNSRGIMHMKRYLSSLDTVEGVAEEIVNSKVLPRILFSKNETSLQTSFENFMSKLPEGRSARRKAEKMNTGKRVVQYWR